MPIATVILTLVVVGVLLWLGQKIPMDATIRQIINVVVVIVVVLWLLGVFGVLDLIGNVRLR